MGPLEILIILLLIWVIINPIIKRLLHKKDSLEVNLFYIMYRTNRLNRFLSKTASSKKKFWQIFANIGIVVGIIEMVLAIYFLVINLYRFIYIPQEAEAIVPFLPGITVSLRWFPYILIAICLAITTHELSHGIIAYLENVPVKSSGIFLTPMTFGGFVEPNNEAFNEASLASKLRITSAGSLSNIIAGVIAILLIGTLFINGSGVLIMNIQDEGPAYKAGIRPWDVILAINGSRISNLSEFITFMSKVGPETLLMIKTSNGLRNVVTTASEENASRGIIGVQGLINYNSMRVGEINTQFSFHLNMTLNWISLLMINVAIFNMIPIIPLDGERFISSLIQRRLKRRGKELRIIINSVFLALIILNFGFSFVKYGITLI